MCWYEQLDEKVREYLPDMTMEREVPMQQAHLLPHRRPRPAAGLSRQPGAAGDPHGTWQRAAARGRSCLGNGTNLLVDGRGLDTAGHQDGGAYDARCGSWTR